MTNSVDPDQMASRSHLIWICTVFKGRGCREQQDIRVEDYKFWQNGKQCGPDLSRKRTV